MAAAVVDEDNDQDEPIRPKKRPKTNESDDEMPRSKGATRDVGKSNKKKKQQQPKSPLPLILGIGGGVLALMLVGLGIAWAAGAFGEKKPTTTTSPPTNQNNTQQIPTSTGSDTSAPQPDVKVTVEELVAKADELKGKVVQFTGKLATLPQSRGTMFTVGVKKGIDIYEAQLVSLGRNVFFKSLETELRWNGKPQIGDEVEIVGKANIVGRSVVIDPAYMIRHTSIPQAPVPKPDIETTAVELVVEVQKNFKDRKTKYQGKVVKITGNIVDVTSGRELLIAAEKPATADSTPGGFPCYLSTNQSVAKLKRMDTVTLIGTIDFINDGNFLSLKNCVVNP